MDAGVQQGIRRAATVPSQLQPRVSSNGSTDTEQLQGAQRFETLFYHQHVKIYSFRVDAVTSGGRRWNSPQAIGTLAWNAPSERVVAVGPLEVYRATHAGTVSFIKSGQLLLSVFPRTQCWCVDGESRFAICQQNDVYRIELPFETDGDKAAVENLKTALSKIVRFEKTACPFRRGFTVDVPDEPEELIPKGPAWSHIKLRKTRKSEPVKSLHADDKQESDAGGSHSENADEDDENGPKDRIAPRKLRDQSLEDETKPPIRPRDGQRSVTTPVRQRVANLNAISPSRSPQPQVSPSRVPEKTELLTEDLTSPVLEQPPDSHVISSEKTPANEQISPETSDQVNGSSITHAATGLSEDQSVADRVDMLNVGLSNALKGEIVPNGPIQTGLNDTGKLERLDTNGDSSIELQNKAPLTETQAPTNLPENVQSSDEGKSGPFLSTPSFGQVDDAGVSASDQQVPGAPTITLSPEEKSEIEHLKRSAEAAIPATQEAKPFDTAPSSLPEPTVSTSEDIKEEPSQQQDSNSFAPRRLKSSSRLTARKSYQALSPSLRASDPPGLVSRSLAVLLGPTSGLVQVMIEIARRIAHSPQLAGLYRISVGSQSSSGEGAPGRWYKLPGAWISSDDELDQATSERLEFDRESDDMESEEDWSDRSDFDTARLSTGREETIATQRRMRSADLGS